MEENDCEYVRPLCCVLKSYWILSDLNYVVAEQSIIHIIYISCYDMGMGGYG